MTKNVMLSIVFIMLIVLCGCSDNKNTTMTIKLAGNPTTGYEWLCNSSNDTIIKLSNDLYTQSKSEDGIVGVGGIYEFTFEGLKNGNATVSCNYKRSWEENTDDISVQYDVKVDSNKKIELIKKSGTLQEIPIPEFN